VTLEPLSASFASTRATAQRLGAHVLSRARHAVTGRIDLTPTPGGFGTLAFGPDHRVLRLNGSLLVTEATGDRPSTTCMSLNGSTLAELAQFAGVRLDSDFSSGADTPPVGDVDVALQLDGAAVGQLGAWFGFGMRVLDVATAHAAEPSRVRIWPEHFDLGIDVAAGASRVNLGASPGDAFHDAPYLYVSPWNADRPGSAEYWNAPFGAVLGYESLLAEAGFERAVDFITEGVSRVTQS